MKKPVFGMLLGGLLGIPDGLSALVSAGDDPNIRAGIVGIVIGSTVKGLIAGLLIGLFAKKYDSLPLGVLFGMSIGLLLAYGVSLMQKAAVALFRFIERGVVPASDRSDFIRPIR